MAKNEFVVFPGLRASSSCSSRKGLKRLRISLKEFSALLAFLVIPLNFSKKVLEKVVTRKLRANVSV